jgi:D-glycero-D-manno-heptose 1,7-bisphosphate phosphatase
MGRYSAVGDLVDPSITSSNQSQQQGSQFNPNDWPSEFPKNVVGLERDGVICERRGTISHESQFEWIPGSLEAIRLLRLKGHKLLILTQQPGIYAGEMTEEIMEQLNNHMMQVFGQNGIFSIDGVFYSTSNLKEDQNSKPATGMFKQAAANTRIRFKNGWYVGDGIEDLKAAEKIGATPILVRTGRGVETEEKLSKFTYRQLKKKTKIFNNLFEFAQSL